MYNPMNKLAFNAKDSILLRFIIRSYFIVKDQRMIAINLSNGLYCILPIFLIMKLERCHFYFSYFQAAFYETYEIKALAAIHLV